MEFDDILKIENIKSKISKFKDHNKLEILISKTSFLPENAKISERIYCLLNNIFERPKCHCGNSKKYINYNLGYSNNCSMKCSYKNNDTIEKRKKTCIDKYGVNSYTKTEEYLNKIKKTNLEKYGVEFSITSNLIKEKTKKTNLEKYGSEHHMKSDDFKKKFIENTIIKYGVENISKLEFVKNKKKETFQKNWNLDHIFSSNKLKGEMFKLKYGYNPYIPDSVKKDFELYKNEVWKYTYRIKKKFIENWNGFDYYDFEYIKDNYYLNYNDSNYPTIDHKISIFYGFKNKINPSVIGSIENICITKRYINRNKSIVNEENFIIQ